MDKNDFDIDFEEEYGFDPKDFLSEDDDFDYSDILEDDASGEDQDATKTYHFAQDSDTFADAGVQDPDDITDEEADEDLTADFPEHDGLDDQFQQPAEDDDVHLYDSPEGEQYEHGYEDEYPEDEEAHEQSVPAKKKKGGLKFPKLPVGGKGRSAGRKHSDPGKKSAFSKILDIYMEPVNKYKEETDVLDPLDPRYIRRRKREKKRIFKEVYLPAIIAGLALCLILSFIVGSVSNAITIKRNKDSMDQQQAQQQASAADAAEAEYKRVVAKADDLVTEYDYASAIQELNNFKNADTSGKFTSQIDDKLRQLVTAQEQLTEIKDISGIPNLSFHVLMADASRACNKDISGADLAGSYNKNFVSVEEFTRILNQLYSSNYVLVDFDSFLDRNSGQDGNVNFFARSIFLPQGKKPVMITETMVNYFEYMVDPDKDGKLDGSGHGFANKLVLDENGDIKAAYVDASGQSLVGNYDLVPVLESFIEEHPDFVYQGARAILAVTGSEGVFGYRTNTAYVSRFGQSFYDNEVVGAKEIVAALREKGYTIASYTYSNQDYRKLNTLQIQAEVTNWTNQITPVLGNVDTIVFARGSDIEAYSGTTFDVLYGSGLRIFLNSGSSPRVDVNNNFVKQTRLMVTGEAMAWYASQFSSYFDSNVVLDLTARGSTPVKS